MPSGVYPHKQKVKFWLGKKRPDMTGKKHFAWKGIRASYRAGHYWIERQLGKPKRCEYCGKDGLIGHQIHWANISGEYKRIISDWKRLCAKCHKNMDSKRLNSKHQNH